VILENLRAIESIGLSLSLVPTESTDELIGQLEAHRKTYRSMSTLLIADRTGELIAGAPAVTDAGVRWWTGSVADRQYFQVPMATGKPAVSDVFLGSGYAENPIIGISAPKTSRIGW